MMNMAREPGVIIKLDLEVVNRIAAGEVIQRPANALKELLENSLDAGSSSIQIVLKSGGMKLLQIQDDGTGIRREDLPILCERHTTSKLEKFEDLESISTYGFRGEALSSISHVAHLSVITKTRDSLCAYKAEYSDGKLINKKEGNPKPCAGNQGTTIIVEDLFYNMETRKMALRSKADEHNRVVDVVTKYAVHNSTVSFSLKRQDETSNEIKTLLNSTSIDNIRLLYGAQLAKELLPVSCDDSTYHFKMSGYISNGSYSNKKNSFLLFINHRLVESPTLKKTIDSIYSAYLPKGSHPFIYMSLEIDPKNVDVNVHPTKYEVHFLHEDVITSSIGSVIDKVLQSSNQSRTFYVQSMLPRAPSSSSTTVVQKSSKNSSGQEDEKESSFNKSIRNIVRTDPKDQKLDKFFTSFSSTTSNSNLNHDDVNKSSKLSTSSKGGSPASTLASSSSSSRRILCLQSVKDLYDKIQSDCHADLLSLFRNHSFIGSVNRSYALIQHETKLCTIDVVRVSTELFYQKLLANFANLGHLYISNPIRINRIIEAALETKSGEVCDQETLVGICDFIMEKAPMLAEYFSLQIDSQGYLNSIPLLLENYIPCMDRIPKYLLNLVRRVNWETEKECFETFCHETAIFYSVPPGKNSEINEMSLNNKTWGWTIEHILFPEIKKSLLPPKIFCENSVVLQAADLPSLYKVFERC